MNGFDLWAEVAKIVLLAAILGILIYFAFLVRPKDIRTFKKDLLETLRYAREELRRFREEFTTFVHDEIQRHERDHHGVKHDLPETHPTEEP